ncbi:aspartyl-phosphate phosphatase Spo0E family protein [Bacillaceae bacterium S4-13-58]
MKSKKQLMQEIEILRRKMMNTAVQEGLTSTQALDLSRKLDRLLNRYEEKKQ